MFDRITPQAPAGSTVRVDSEGVSVIRFSNGACAVMVAKQALHLNPEQAQMLALVLGSLFPQEAA